MVQIGVGVAVLVFGPAFALGDFLPSGRYGFKSTTKQYQWCIVIVQVRVLI